MAKQNKQSPSKKEMIEMIIALEQRVLTLQMFLDAMSQEFQKYITFNDHLDAFKEFKNKYNEDNEKDA